MTTRPSLWIMLMWIAYCDKVQISIAKGVATDATPNYYQVQIGYGDLSDKFKKIVPMDDLSYFVSAPKKSKTILNLNNVDNKICRTELYMASYSGEYEYFKDNKAELEMNDNTDDIFIYLGTWFPSGSDIVEFYIHIDKGNKLFQSHINKLYIRIEVGNDKVSTRLMKARNGYSFEASLVKNLHRVQDIMIVKDENRALIQEADREDKLIYGNLECQHDPNILIELDSMLIKKAGKGMFHLTVFTKEILYKDSQLIMISFAENRNPNTIDTNWAKIVCTQHGIKFTYTNLNKKILEKIKKGDAFLPEELNMQRQNNNLI